MRSAVRRAVTLDIVLLSLLLIGLATYGVSNAMKRERPWSPWGNMQEIWV